MQWLSVGLIFFERVDKRSGSTHSTQFIARSFGAPVILISKLALSISGPLLSCVHDALGLKHQALSIEELCLQLYYTTQGFSESARLLGILRSKFLGSFDKIESLFSTVQGCGYPCENRAEIHKLMVSDGREKTSNFSPAE